MAEPGRATARTGCSSQPAVTHRWTREAALGAVLLTSCLLGACTDTARPVARDALPPPCSLSARVADDVSNHVLPFWLATVDGQHGGYAIERAGGADAAIGSKQLVTQARLVWSFSHAHRAGLAADARYLDAATKGYQFLARHFHDAANGGYYWTTDRAGQPLDTRKILYGQAFALFALVEYFRAAGDPAALDEARRLFDVLERHARDRERGGWVEHFTREWRPILAPGEYLLVEIAGLKSANTHLHLMEALTELADAAPAPAIRAALADALAINERVFFPAPDRTVQYTALDWSAPARRWSRSAIAERAREISFGSPRLSYGHNVEFAWMAVRARQVLGLAPDWTRFDALLGHALDHGYDRARGGLYDGGYGTREAWFTGKTWWAQAELLTALTIADARPDRPAYADTLGQHVDWLLGTQADPITRVWRWSMTGDGTVSDGRLAADWKTAYHDLRATLAYLEHCGERPTPTRE